MSIALNSTAGPSSGLAIAGAACGLIFDSPDNRRGVVAAAEEVTVSSETSSSIGKNSDDDESDGENDEAQSSYKGPLDMMNALEEVLPMRRGISKFYNCKSKSFTSLAEASSSSNIKDIAKADNAYARKRRNLLASNQMWEKNRNLQLRSNGISKRPISTSRSSLALAVRLNSCSESSTSSASEDSYSSPNSPLPQPPGGGGGYPTGNQAGWRSYSLADLQECAVSSPANSSRFSPENQMCKN